MRYNTHTNILLAQTHYIFNNKWFRPIVDILILTDVIELKVSYKYIYYY